MNKLTNLENKIVFKSTKDSIDLEVRLEDDTVWLTQSQMAKLFDKDVNTVGEHIQNIFLEEELDGNSTSRKFRVVRKEGRRMVPRDITHYNLDMIISVGYRVNSKRGTQFRIWATKILKDHLVQGYTLNQKRLEAETQKYHELMEQLKTLKKVYENETFAVDEAKSLIKIITDYASGLDLIERFDKSDIKISKKTIRPAFEMDYDNAVKSVNELRISLIAGQLFGNERECGFRSTLQSIYQTFDGKDLYPSLEEKAANLLYLIIKNHPFSDGNKRIGSFMFLRFLDLNGLLYKDDGSKRIEQNALVAIALMIAQSDPKIKDLMAKLVVNLI